MADNEKQQEIADIFQQAEAAQNELLALQQKIFETEFIGEAGNGVISIIVNGAHWVESVELDDAALAKEINIIQDILMAAINDASKKIEKNMTQAVAGMQQIRLPDGYSDS